VSPLKIKIPSKNMREKPTNSSDVVRVRTISLGIHNILSTAPQLNISQKVLGTLPEDGNVMPKRVGATIHNITQQNLTFLAHEEKCLILIELLTLNSNV
jgi:hypothetical protein